jgi:hypothetical protein
MKKTTKSDFEWVIKVLKSVKNTDQLLICSELFNNFIKKHQKTMKKHDILEKMFTFDHEMTKIRRNLVKN